MKITVLASGSKGNSTLIETKTHNILIDAGITLNNLEKRLQEKVLNIDTLIITHMHIDHIKGLRSIYKKYKCNIYTKCELLITDEKYNTINCSEKIILDELEIELFDLSHDSECSGISIKEDKTEAIYITDTGYINQKILKKIINKDIYIIESNHDTNTLLSGKYPFYLKQRILSDKGHLSNKDSAKYVSKIIGDKTSYIVLAHLSEENNLEELAKKELEKVLGQVPNNIKKIYIAKQDESLETIEV